MDLMIRKKKEMNKQLNSIQGKNKYTYDYNGEILMSKKYPSWKLRKLDH